MRTSYHTRSVQHQKACRTDDAFGPPAIRAILATRVLPSASWAVRARGSRAVAPHARAIREAFDLLCRTTMRIPTALATSAAVVLVLVTSGGCGDVQKSGTRATAPTAPPASDQSTPPDPN